MVLLSLNSISPKPAIARENLHVKERNVEGHVLFGIFQYPETNLCGCIQDQAGHQVELN
jgi:hypothetical protein